MAVYFSKYQHDQTDQISMEADKSWRCIKPSGI